MALRALLVLYSDDVTVAQQEQVRQITAQNGKPACVFSRVGEFRGGVVPDLLLLGPSAGQAQEVAESVQLSTAPRYGTLIFGAMSEQEMARQFAIRATEVDAQDAARYFRAAAALGQFKDPDCTHWIARQSRAGQIVFHDFALAEAVALFNSQMVAGSGLEIDMDTWASRVAKVDSFSDLNACLRVGTCVKRVVRAKQHCPIWVLNLDRRPDRWRETQDRFDWARWHPTVAIRLHRWPATDGRLVKQRLGVAKVSEDEAPSYLRHLLVADEFKKRPGVFGCTASHDGFWRAILDGTIWKTAINAAAEKVHVAEEKAEGEGDAAWHVLIEDDCVLSPTFWRDIGILCDSAILRKLATMCDLVWIGYHCHVPHRWYQIKSADPLTVRPLEQCPDVKGIGGTFGYMLTKRGAAKLHTAIKQLRPGEPIDRWMMQLPSNVIKQAALPRALVFSDFMDPRDPTTWDTDIQKDEI